MVDIDRPSSRRPSYIIVVGSGYSGSGALFDYLSGRPDVATAISGNEFRLGIDPGGLGDLSYALGEGFHPNRASAAIKNFYNLCRQYGRPRSALPPGLGYAELIPGYSDIVNAYMHALIDLEYRAMPFVELAQLSSLRAYLVGLARRFYRRRNKKPPIGTMKIPVSQEKFHQISETFIDHLLQRGGSDSRSLSVLVNQAGSFWRPVSSTTWFGKRNIVVVTRDPRDVYADFKRRGYAYPGADVKQYVAWYKNVMNRIAMKEWNAKEVLHVQFEALTSNPDDECERMVSRLGLDAAVDSSYDLTQSYENVGRYLNELDDTEVTLIENELGPHLWDA